jgi:hypothetical protein
MQVQAEIEIGVKAQTEVRVEIATKGMIVSQSRPVKSETRDRQRSKISQEKKLENVIRRTKESQKGRLLKALVTATQQAKNR